MELLNTAVGLAALFLGGFAVWLSIHFYEKSKETEKAVAITLEAIRAQSEALQRLTGRWMDRFTRHATQPKPADEGLLTLVAAVANLPTTILTHLRIQPESGQSLESAIQEAVNGYIGLYYYSALSNVLAQATLPNEEVFDAQIDWHTAVQRIIDRTATDFQYMAGVLNSIERRRIDTSPIAAST